MRIASRTPGYLTTEYFPTGVKWLLIVNIALFVLYYLATLSDFGYIFRPFWLQTDAVLHSFAIYQLFTYMFLHDPRGFGHILFNMLALWMFGADLERSWGRKQFLKFYFLCGVGAGVCVVIANALFENRPTWTIGASGAIYGLLMAFGVLYPDRIVLFSFLFPIKAKYFVMIIGAIAFLSSLGASGSGVSHVAHLGGMLFGFLYLRSGIRLRYDFAGNLQRQYQQWKINRAKRKFEVYLRKRNDRDKFVH